MLLLSFFTVAAKGWSWPGTPDQSHAASQRFDQLCSQQPPSCITLAAVYARKGKSCEAGNVVAHTARGDAVARDAATCWYHIGDVACVGGVTSLPLAIHTQRAMIIELARARHKELRPFQTLLLAWTTTMEEAQVDPALGSFRCPNCGAANEASAQACSNCGASRPDNVGEGSLTLAVAPQRTRPLEPEACGFRKHPNGIGELATEALSKKTK